MSQTGPGFLPREAADLPPKRRNGLPDGVIPDFHLSDAEREHLRSFRLKLNLPPLTDAEIDQCEKDAKFVIARLLVAS